MNADCSRKAGFTLIELLFAIFIFAIVISSVYGAYRATFHIIQGSEAHLNESHRARTALERITDDLSAVVTGPTALFRGVEQDVSGARGDSLSFLSSTHVALREDDTLSSDTVIQYNSELDEKSKSINLMRSDRVRRPGDGTENIENSAKFLLCSGLKEVRFTYFDQTGEETTEWDTENLTEEDETSVPPELPVMISIELIFPGEDTSTNGSVFKTAVALSRILEE